MSINDILKSLYDADIKLSVDGDSLEIKAPKGALTADLRELLLQNKAEIIETLKLADAMPLQAPVLSKRANLEEYPLSAAQERLWLITRLEPDSAAYNVPHVQQIKGRLDISSLEAAINTVVQRHETLRAKFSSVNGRALQSINPDFEFKLSTENFTAYSPEDARCHADKSIREEILRAFNISQDALIRGRLLQLTENESVLLITMHHIVSDGWSVDILFHEISDFYNSIIEKQSANEKPLPIQYADFAQWQRQRLKEPAMDEQLAYWVKYLEHVSPLELPFDRQRKDIKGYKGAVVPFELDANLVTAVKRSCVNEKITLSMLMSAAYSILLHKYSSQDDIVFGTPVANRNLTEIENLIGFFVNMLVVRTDLSANPTVKAIYQQVAKNAIASYEYQDVPFERIVEAIQPERSQNKNPVFQVILALHSNNSRDATTQNMSANALYLKDCEVSNYELNIETTRFDIELHVSETPTAISGAFVYDTDLFNDATIAAMKDGLLLILQQMVENADMRIADINPVTDEQYRRLLMDFNHVTVPYPGDKNVVALFQQQVAETPDANAVVHEGKALSYSELNQRASQLANYLITAGIKPDNRVVVLMERTPNLIIAQLAILMAGAAYVAIDPDYPTQRLAFILEDTQPPVLLTRSSLGDRVSDYQGRIICLDTESEMLAGLSAQTPTVDITAHNLAYVIYTSGSTGTPKGVEVEHGGLLNLVSWHHHAYEVSPADRATHLAGLGFDASVWELWPYLTSGASVYLVSDELRHSPVNLWSWMAVQGITLSFLPTPLAEAVLREPIPDGLKLRALLTGGDQLHGGLVNKKVPFRVVNHYGPTENAVVATCCEVDLSCEENPPIGIPIDNVQTYILDQHQKPVPIGVSGELCIGGESLARGYLNQPTLTQEKFVANPFSDEDGARLYRTGDLVRYRGDGQIEFLGRIDNQVKVRGFRIELGDIEAVLRRLPGIESAVVLAREDEPGDKRLVAYVVSEADQLLNADEIRTTLFEMLPDYMVPSAFVLLDALPLTYNGKVDKDALPALDAERLIDEAYIAPRSNAETGIAEIWKDVLKLEQVGVHDNFFTLGGNSLLLAQVHEKVQKVLDTRFPVIDLFKYPTISALASHLLGDNSTGAKKSSSPVQKHAQEGAQKRVPVAIVGMAGRFPGARDVEAFWNNLRDGVESIAFYSDEELAQAGVPDALLKDPDFVKAGVHVHDIDLFDAEFFGYSPRQAQVIDPQQRFFLECAWEVFERAGYNPERYPGRVGVYGGVSTSSYSSALMHNQELAKSFSSLDILMGNDKDFLTTRVSYNLNLKGPGITLQTACSTSLVATHLAIQGLSERDCDMAIAGGSAIRNYQPGGYTYQEGGILSPDGHCRAFDAKAKGTLSGDGTAVVLLKRLDDALADGDQIYAVIKGSAINNDGSQKIGYAAPGVQGQVEVVSAAQAQADVDPRSISYVEAHGTGTPLGDPIEIEALTQVFQNHTQDKNFCAIGSVKTNIGHLDSAAGVAGLIKTTMALWHKELPPSLHYHSPNPQIDFENNPFFVNAKLTPWKAEATPRRAGVSSFGIGGTNAHVVLEEAPVAEPSSEARDWQLLVLSAKTKTALEQMTDNLHRYLQCNPEVNMADLAYTLQVGRKEFKYRRAVLSRNVKDAIEVLESRDSKRVLDSVVQDTDRRIVFMFTGQGAQYPGMGLHLYQNQSHYRETVDQCCEVFHAHLGFDLRDVLFPAEEDVARARTRLNQTEITQCALFVTELALARLWMSWGITPSAMIGHSIGEYVAACLSGVMSLEVALQLVAERGRLMGQLPGGSMLAVTLSEAELKPMLTQGLEIATINGPEMCVVSGSDQAVDSFAAQLDKKDIQTHKLHTSHAFHSSMMEPALKPFAEYVGKVRLEQPQIPYISNVTGSWITHEDATRAQYYAQHLRSTVRFSDGLEQIFSQPEHQLLEVGPGHTLSSLAKYHPARQASQMIVSSLRHATEEISDEAFMWQAIGGLWLAGGQLDWDSIRNMEKRHRILLPSYPFERQRYWIETGNANADYAFNAQQKLTPLKQKDLEQWCYLPVWKSSLMISADDVDAADYSGRWMIFQDQSGLGEQLAAQIEKLGGDVIRVKPSENFNKVEPRLFELNPASREHYNLLFNDDNVCDLCPDRIIHAWGLNNGETSDLGVALESGYYSLLYLMQAIEKQWPVPQMHIDVITNNVQAVTGSEQLRPENAFVTGLCKVLAIELPAVSCRNIDIELSDPGTQPGQAVLSGLLAEMGEVSKEIQVAYRWNRRWIVDYDRVSSKKATRSPRLRERGVYLITGGVGGVGLVLAEHLAKTVNARLILTSRTELPQASAWDEWLQKHDENNATSRKILKLRDLEEQGAELMVAAVDVADHDQMQALIEKAQQRFGVIHGVIHAAGVTAGPSMDLFQNLKRENCELQFHPKVYGLLLLKELFEEQVLDFMMPVSSLSTVLGGLGFAAYTAANQFMDTLTQQQYWLGNKNWISVDWEGWDFSRQSRQEIKGSSESFALTPDEGSLVFDHILRLGRLPQVVISTGDLLRRIEQWDSHEQSQEKEKDEIDNSQGHARPTLSSDYVEPASDAERALAGIWQSALGIDHIGIRDNFFELGGDSVLNIRITALAKEAGLILTPKDVFEHQTIAELAMVASAAQVTEPEPEHYEDTEETISEDDLAEILRQQEL